MSSICKPRIVSARVYRVGCLMTFAGEAEVAPGQNEILVDCLVAGVSADSVKVKVPAGVALLSVSAVEREHHAQTDTERELASLKERISSIDAKITVRGEQRAKWLDIPVKSMDIDSYAEYVEDLPEKLDAVDEEIAELKKSREPLAERMAEVQEKREEESRELSRMLLSLKVDAADGMLMPFEIAARSTQAGWSPLYEISADGMEHSVETRTRASVYQKTGLPWEGVSLVLSTSAPSIGLAVPRLRPNGIRRLEAPRRNIGGMAAAKDMSVPIDDEMAKTGMVILDSVSLDTVVAESMNSREYSVPGKWDVPSDGDVILDLKTSSMEASYARHTVPVLDPSAYIVAELDGEFDLEMQGCDAAVYLAGEYCGMTVIPFSEPGEATTVSFGTDSRISVSRECVKSVSRKGSLLRGNDTEEKGYRITISSARSEDAEVIIHDQIPVSHDSDIVITPSFGEGCELDGETGELVWRETVPANGKISVEFSYTVSKPRGVEISPI